MNRIGFIGQGFIGKNYADDFERRGYTVVRYSKEPQYEANAGALLACDIVFIAVPTPTKPSGFDSSIIEAVLPLVQKGKIAVIKSTILPGTTEALQAKFPEIAVLHSPEFLTEATAAEDASGPARNIVGVPENLPKQFSRGIAQAVLDVLPPAPYAVGVDARVAEAIKYGGNCWFYFKVLFMNTLYDFCFENGIDFEQVKEGMAADPRVGPTHLDVVHQGGRGAGGHCFVKDFAAYREAFALLDMSKGQNRKALAMIEAMETYNKALLRSSGKSLEIVDQVYGKA